MNMKNDDQNIERKFLIGGRFTILQTMSVIAIAGLVLTSVLHYFFG